MSIESSQPTERISGREVVKGALIGCAIAAVFCLIEYFIPLGDQKTLALTAAKRMMDSPPGFTPDSAIQAWEWLRNVQLATGTVVGGLLGARYK